MTLDPHVGLREPEAEQATDAVRSQTLRIDPAVRRMREHVQVSGYFGDADRGFIGFHYCTGVVG